MLIILGILITVTLINISIKLDSHQHNQQQIILRLRQIERELAYNKITNIRLTDTVINTQDIVNELVKIKEDVFNLRYYIGAVYHDELKEFAKKKEKGL